MTTDRRDLLKLATTGEVAAGVLAAETARAAASTYASAPALSTGLGAAVHARGLGVGVGVVNQWNWGVGSFEAIHIDPDTGMRSACGDPRRCALAEEA